MFWELDVVLLDVEHHSCDSELVSKIDITPLATVFLELELERWVVVGHTLENSSDK